MTPLERAFEQWDLLLEVTRLRKEELTRERGGSKGPLVVGEEAQELFSKAACVLGRVLDRECPLPKMVFYPAISQLKGRFRRLSLGLGASLMGISGLVVYMVSVGQLSVTEGYYCALPILFVLPFPWSLYRRMGEYMDRGSYYLQDERTVIIYDLPRGRFLSYCAHELAFHLLMVEGPSWEFYGWGWARGVQRLVSEKLGEGALAASLELMVGELRVALGWLSREGGKPLPSWVKRLPSPYHKPWWSAFWSGQKEITYSLLGRALSTAHFQLLEAQDGPGVYKDYLDKRVDERWLFVSSDPREWLETGD